jgi:hypothetical protein
MIATNPNTLKINEVVEWVKKLRVGLVVGSCEIVTSLMIHKRCRIS